MRKRLVFGLLLLGVAALVAWQAGAFVTDAPAVGEGADAAPRAREARPLPKTAPPTANGPRVVGRVIDAAGAPVEEARVLAIAETTQQAFTLDDVGKEGFAPTAGVFDAITGADGRFVVAASDDAPLHALVVLATSGGIAYTPGVRPDTDVTLRVESTGSVRGTVQGEFGEPVAGAAIVLHVQTDALYTTQTTISAADGTFRLPRVPSRRGLLSAVYEVSAPFRERLVLYASLPGPAQEVEQHVVLGVGGVLEGRVVDGETHAPLEGVRVVAWAYGVRLGFDERVVGRPWEATILGETRSGPEGAFRFDHWPRTAFHWHPYQGSVAGGVVAVGPNRWAVTRVDFAKHERGTVAVTLRMWAKASVRGRVVDSVGQPVEGAWVQAWVPRRSSESDLAHAFGLPPATVLSHLGLGEGDRIRTAPDGTYHYSRLGVAEHGEEEVRIQATRLHPRGPSDSDGAVNVAVRVAAGRQVNAPDFVMTTPGGQGPPLIAWVRVLLPDGRPAWGASVTTPSSWVGRAFRSDRDGWAALRVSGPVWPPFSGPVEVTAWMPGFVYTQGAVTPIPASEGMPATHSADGTGPGETTIRLQEGHVLAGRVRTHEGGPARDCEVAIGNGSRPPLEVFRDGRGDVYDRMETDEEGRFRFVGLPEGPYHVRAEPRGIPGVRVPAQPALVADVVSNRNDVEVVLGPAPPPTVGGIAGSFRDATTGRAPLDVTVQLQRDGRLLATAASGSDWRAAGYATLQRPGRFVVHNMPPGPVEVRITADGYVRGVLTSTIVAGEITHVPAFDLRRGVTLVGRVHLADGVPRGTHRDLVFTAIDDGGEAAHSFRTRLADDLSFEISGLESGRYRVVSSAADGSSPLPPCLPREGPFLHISAADGTVTYEPTLLVGGFIEVGHLDPRLPPSSETGTATDEQRRFAAGCCVAIHDAAGTLMAEQRGHLTQGNLIPRLSILVRPGLYWVRNETPEEEATTVRLEVEAGKTEPVWLGVRR